MAVLDLNYIAQDVEVNNSCSDEEWEDAKYLAEEILQAKEQNIAEGARFWCLVTAANINWRGAGGVGLWEMYAGNQDDIDNFWSRISGINGDWTLRVEKIPDFPKQFDCVAYSHDTPTGGARRVRFLTSKELLHKVLLDGSRGRLDELKADFDCSSKVQLVEYLDNNATAEEIKEYL